MKFSLNLKLAFFALTLSLLALIASIFFTDHLPSENISGSNYITVLDLAESIKNRDSITLIDLRSNEDFDQFHIPTAKNLILPELIDDDFNANTKIVLYSEGDSLSSQAFFALKRKGITKIRVLKGGVQAWYNRLLYPRMPKEVPIEDKALANRVKSLSTYFGGRSEFVDEGNPLDYYKNEQSSQPIFRSKLVRMGC